MSGGPEFFPTAKGGTRIFPVGEGGYQNFLAYVKGGPEKIGNLQSQTDAPPSRYKMMAP